jgi:hypothetical protein
MMRKNAEIACMLKKWTHILLVFKHLLIRFKIYYRKDNDVNLIFLRNFKIIIICPLVIIFCHFVTEKAELYTFCYVINDKKLKLHKSGLKEISQN